MTETIVGTPEELAARIEKQPASLADRITHEAVAHPVVQELVRTLGNAFADLHETLDAIGDYVAQEAESADGRVAAAHVLHEVSAEAAKLGRIIHENRQHDAAASEAQQ